MPNEAIIGGLVTAILGLAGFIKYLFSYVLADKDKQLADKDKQLEAITADRNEWKTNALTVLKLGEIVAFANRKTNEENEPETSNRRNKDKD